MFRKRFKSNARYYVIFTAYKTLAISAICINCFFLANYLEQKLLQIYQSFENGHQSFALATDTNNSGK